MAFHTYILSAFIPDKTGRSPIIGDSAEELVFSLMKLYLLVLQLGNVAIQNC